MKTKKEQLGLLSLIWMGVSFIAGITFTASFAGVVTNTNDEGQNVGVGIHILWIFVLEGIVAFMCAWAFAKLVKQHPQANGGASQYVRTAFGKFWGLLMGIINYSVIPLIGMGLIVSMVRQNFDGGDNNLVGYDKNNQINPWGSWGPWGSLYLDLIAFGLYMFAATIIFFGIKKYKYVSIIIGYMTWGITILIMIFGLVAGFTSESSGLDQYVNNSSFGFSSFSKTFTTCFFAFAGIETFITTGKNIKNRSKNMPIAIIIIMIATTVFYILFSLIIMFAVNAPFSGNPNLQIFKKFDSDFLKKFGPWLIIVCTVLMRFNSSLQVTMFGGSTLEPLASQRFISKLFKKENKENVPIAGVLTTIIIIMVTGFLFLFIPDIVQGIAKKPSPFNYGTIANSASILLLLIYYMVIPTALVQGFRKKIKIKVWEYIGWILTMILLTFFFVMYFIDLINGFMKTDDIQSILSSTFQLLYLVIVFVTAILLYFVYHKKLLIKIKSNNEEMKILNDYESVFKIIEIPNNI
ncbi:putative permease [Spiroplasma litorale]|uniref:Putative permease n=1 Tax=Spiroplasma litorale TaxID=216942 RepID=A0A0K1W0Z5_9MOLU|nr:APC family permease [Spiroplasma litorale]AKX33838.1 putative permease [Spiroplasma litorale]